MSSSLSEVFKFKVGVPPTLFGNVPNVPPLYQHETSSINCRQPARRNVGKIFENGTLSKMPPPQATVNPRRPFQHTLVDTTVLTEMPPPRAVVLPRRPFQHTLVDESVLTGIPFGHRIPAQSTPMQSFQGARNLFRPAVDSTPALSNWSAIGSTSGSVRSFCSNNNTEFIDAILQRGLNKLLAKGRFNPEYEDFAVQLANGLKRCVQEAALELAPEGSVRSHFSKHATTWQSGMSIMSDKSQSTLHSLHKLRKVTPRLHQKISPAKGIECSMERVKKSRRPYGRITEEQVDSHLPANFSVVEKTIQPNKRSLSIDDNEKECSEPQTVRRRLNNDDHVTSTTAQGYESPTSTCDEVIPAAWSSPQRKGAKPTHIDALVGRAGILTHDDDNDFKPTPAAKKGKTAPKKRQAKPQPEKKKQNKKSSKSASPSVNVVAVATLAVLSTRSGRNVKKPSFYQVPGKKKSKRTASAANGENEKNKSSSEKVENPDAEKPSQKVPRKPVVRKPAKPATPVVEEPAPVTFSKRGRAVKATVFYGGVKNLSPSPAVVNSAKAKKTAKVSPKKTKTGKPTKAKNEKSPMKKDTIRPTPSNRKIDNDSDDDLSISGIDFYIPEVTQSTRRGAKPKNATERSLTVQTPPISHLTANLHSAIVASASNTGRTTPDWQPSQRTESEAKELQKRKLGPRRKKQSKEPVKKVRPVKQTPIAQKILKLARKSIAAKLAAESPVSSSYESESE